MIILKSIHIQNYKSIIDEKFELSSMTSFVGANESGKSNILDCISHLSKEKQDKSFTQTKLNLTKHIQKDNLYN